MRSTIFIALGLVALLAAILLTQFSDDEAPSAPAQVSEPDNTPSIPETVKQQPEPKAENILVKPQTTQEETAPKVEISPSFDVVRIDPEGDAVLAGRAPEGAEVTILDGETVVGSAKADDRGEWVFLPSQPLEAGKRQLNLQVTKPDGSVEQADEVVVLVVPERAEESLAVVMPRQGSGTVRALQTPNAEALMLSITAVNYDDAGALSVSGNAIVGADILIYLDNDLLGQAKANGAGAWAMSTQKDIAVGHYKLRADHIDDAGKVLNRVTIPFARSESLQGVPKDRQIVVQPGNSLWRIARHVYGTGFDYTVIYQANESQINDPDLIYPGQIFELPAQ